jgi:uncharacterized protein YkwD
VSRKDQYARLQCLPIVFYAALLLLVCKQQEQEIILRTEEIKTLECRVFDLVNEHRQKLGLNSLLWNEFISSQARLHSVAMATRREAFSHANFESRARSIAQRIPYRDCAENIGMNLGFHDPAEKFVQGWVQSPGHRKNLEGNFNLSGIGIARSSEGIYYATQIFVLTR